MKRLMEAELMFDTPEYRDRAIAELAQRGLEAEILDWVDEWEGVVLTPTVWIKVRGAYALDDHGFFNEMAQLAEHFGGDVVEAGFADPLPPVA